MKQLLSLLLIFFCFAASAQKEGEIFCDVFVSDSFFPLDYKKKKIIWGNTHYFEEISGQGMFDGVQYIAFTQVWETGMENTLFLREENGITYQYYENTGEEIIRLDTNLKKGQSWEAKAIGTTYTVLSTKGKLKTPFCTYKKLIVLKTEYRDATYIWYYKKGQGYVGATDTKKNLISYLTPKWK